MALTQTTELALRFNAPDFSLPDTVSGNPISLDEVKGPKATVVMFICNHCPYVIHIREALVRLANEYQHKEVSFVAISSNDVVKYPDDDPEKMRELALEMNFPFPYLYDETQEVAKAYDAACTPDFSVFDHQLKCVYRGRFDESTPGNDKPVTGNDLRTCLDLLLKDGSTMQKQFPSLGCNIKWK